MNLIASWIKRLRKLRNVIAREQIAVATFIPSFLSSLWAQMNSERDDEDSELNTTPAEYVFIVVVLAIVVIAAYGTFGGSNRG